MPVWTMSGRDPDYIMTVKLGKAGNLAERLEDAVKHFDLKPAYEEKLASVEHPELLETNPVGNVVYRIRNASKTLQGNRIEREIFDTFYWSPFDIGDMTEVRIEESKIFDTFGEAIKLMGLRGKAAKTEAAFEVIGRAKIDNSIAHYQSEKRRKAAALAAA